MELNLQAYRCPSAMTQAQLAIKMAHSSNESLWLHSIEPMLEHHIKAYLASEYPSCVYGQRDNRSDAKRMVV